MEDAVIATIELELYLGSATTIPVNTTVLSRTPSRQVQLWLQLHLVRIVPERERERDESLAGTLKRERDESLAGTLKRERDEPLAGTLKARNERLYRLELRMESGRDVGGAEDEARGHNVLDLWQKGTHYTFVSKPW